MRDIDRIIRAVEEDNRIPPVHKRVLINRIEPEPTRAELDRAAAEVHGSKDRTDAAPYRLHDLLCVDQPGYPHDNECECWCHDEADGDTGSNQGGNICGVVHYVTGSVCELGQGHGGETHYGPSSNGSRFRWLA